MIVGASLVGALNTYTWMFMLVFTVDVIRAGRPRPYGLRRFLFVFSRLAQIHRCFALLLGTEQGSLGST